MKKLIYILVSAIFALSACSKQQVDNAKNINIEEITNKVCALANMRYYGYDASIVNAIVHEDAFVETNGKILEAYRNTEDNFVDLEDIITNEEYNLKENEGGKEKSGEYVLDEEGNEVWLEHNGTGIIDTSQYYLDERIEIKNGRRGVYRTSLEYNEDGMAYVVIYNMTYRLYKEYIIFNINDLKGNREYLFSIDSYSYFEDGTLIIDLKTKDETVANMKHVTVCMEVMDNEKVVISNINSIIGSVD